MSAFQDSLRYTGRCVNTILTFWHPQVSWSGSPFQDSRGICPMQTQNMKGLFTLGIVIEWELMQGNL